ncbi:MAG TPA: HAMP domain-containing sensor histidine kinase [Syntrophorhabdaceae bacterium]|nr:HAMP domain-containing sensor histidine kinase [Syntrophorhabdaceae bacterium]
MAEAALTDENSNKEWRGLAGDMVSECDHLLDMINTMLDISEAEAGVMSVNVEEMDMVSLIHDAAELFRPLAEDKGIAVTVEVPASLPLTSDRRKLQRVLGNILDNAIKFSRPSGMISLKAYAEDDRIVVHVSDNGVGILKQDLPHIFDRFFRGEKSRSEPGSGLGLSLAKALAASLKASITVESASRQGSVFTVVLPRHFYSSLPSETGLPG